MPLGGVLSSIAPNMNITASQSVEPAGRNAAIGLKDYLDGLAAILRAQPEAWVRCEVLELKPGAKFVRMDLVEQDAAGKQQAAVSGGCWPGVLARIQQAFADNGLRLDPGCKVLVKLRANLQAAYGFRVEVLDVDPSYTLGDHKARMEAIRTRLREAGHWERNRLLPRPRDFLRVAVISPAGAAGQGDFRATAATLASRGLVAFEYLEAPFQTADAPAEILKALRSIYPHCKTGEFCAVAIVRGGGASSDLAWLVDHDLTRAVCLMPVPVMTGIGHERDSTLLDEVACMPFDTPSKVAEHVRAAVANAAMAADQSLRAIRAQAGADLAALCAGAQRADQEVTANVLGFARLSGEAVRAASGSLRPGARLVLDQSRALADGTLKAVAANARSMRDVARSGAAEAARIVSAGAAAQMKQVEATLREAKRVADLAPTDIMQAATIGLSTANREISAGTGMLIRAAEQGIASAQGYAGKAPANAAAAATDALNRISRLIDAVRVEALGTAELAVGSRTQEARSAPAPAFEAAQAAVGAQAAAIAGHAVAALRVPGEEVARMRADIASRTAAVPDAAASMVASALASALQDAQRGVDGAQATVTRIQAMAEALDPANVVGAGYAILRNGEGKPLTGIAAVTAAELVRVELRDGSAILALRNRTERA